METNPKITPLKNPIDLKSTSPVQCEACLGEAFQEALMLRKVSPIITGTGREGFVPIQVFACAKCGHVNSNFIPADLRTSVITPAS